MGQPPPAKTQQHIPNTRVGAFSFSYWRKRHPTYKETMASPYTICEYVKRAGPCGKRCYGGLCKLHRNRVPQTSCLKGCGRGTRSQTGFCCHCGWAQNDACHRLKKQRDEMEAYLDEILSWDWPAWLAWHQTKNQATAASAASGSLA